MKLVTVDVPFPEKLEMPIQKLDSGEYITARIVEISKLASEFKGLFKHRHHGGYTNHTFFSRVREEGKGGVSMRYYTGLISLPPTGLRHRRKA